MQALFKATKQPSLTRVLAIGRSRALGQTTRARIVRPAASFHTVVYHGDAPNSPEFRFDETQVFGSEVKLNPSQSEANVAADRGEIDPLPMGMHHTILLDAGGTSEWTSPTESEADVRADRYMDDPLRGNTGGYC
ncbi:hypothetical protein GE09DRAFT_13888 [Coniochaeta sp. 2T2.1]|nr:hypothetical protein GE09DRAFT_13888 [Coniochaeta sp. 2T2.1]